jgi:site-specific DNA-methyltransferase (adenine-specific)
MRLIHGEALEELDKLIDEGVKVDAIITDPPYGTTSCKWDSIIPFDEMWLRLKQLRKDKTPIVLFGSEPFSSNLRVSNIKEYKYDWIWHKSIPSGMFSAKYQPMKNHEVLMVFGKGKIKFNPIKEKRSINTHSTGKGGKYISNSQHTQKFISIRKETKGTKRNPTTIKYFNNVPRHNSIHPTQKPVALMEYLIKTYTNEGDTVLDFTMGSGSTGVACKNLNRDFIGIELDERYYNISKDRIEGKLTDKEIKEKYKG